MEARLRRTLVVGFVVLLGLGGLALPAATVAAGVGPNIISPTASDLHYSGYHGPFLVDFTNVPTGTYDYSVSPSGAVFTHDWNGTDSQPASLPIPSLPQGSYVFDITDNSGHETSLAFDVRGPQPRCTLIVPSAVRVKGPEAVIAGRLSADCARAHVTYASWDVRNATQGFVNLLSFDHTTTDTWKYGAFSDALGTYLAVPTAANGTTDDDILQNAPRTTIRLASRLGLGAVRAGAFVTLRASLTEYAPKALAFRAWAGRRVAISYRNCATCPWRSLASRTTNTHGVVTLRVRSQATRVYRVTALGTSRVWAPGAATVRR